MQTENYNGWTNYETWVINLWTNGELPLDLTKESIESGDAACQLREIIDEMCPEIDGMFGDLLQGALSEINYYELVKEWYELDYEDDENGEESDNE
jgi:hypothetical protein